ncbi:MAG: tetratricopeptide repeat protein [Candidatus Sericytochromatia bacterium]|nr:tetratricopeptide repeat protein [Candidatus Tanganyikabacteria bacterium]
MRPFLRDQPDDLQLFACEVEQLQAEIEDARLAGDEARLLAALGRAGDLCRALGQSRRAVDALEEAVALARTERDRARLAANLIRLGTAFQYADEHATAERFLREALALAEAEGLGPYVGFACQHLGKCLAEQGRYGEARDAFDRALGVRQEAGDRDLAASTRRALELLDRVEARAQ